MTLREAYNAANLSRAGWSFERAMADPTMRRCLEHTANARVTHRVSRYADTYHCTCGRQWAVDDNEPPVECRT